MAGDHSHLAQKDSAFRVLDPDFFNAAVPPADLAGQTITPVSRFFSRNHAAIPAIAPERWTLTVEGLVREPLTLTLADLRARFAEATLPATLVCAGLRRTELAAVREIPGELPWGAEPAGTAEWRGFRLSDVLAQAGVTSEARHVEFVGLDDVERHGRRFGFGGSIPVEKALAGEVLLACGMNGAALPPVHGGPVRVLVPGYYGARSVKWVHRIVARREVSDNYFHAEAYRVLRRPDPARPRSVAAGEPLGELPLNVVILSPESGDAVRGRTLVVRGWALAGAAPVGRVEVSPDGGRTWTEAAMGPEAGRWAWRLWQAEVEVAAGPAALVARAWDARGRGQPERPDELWNVKGYANAAWHRVPVTVS